MHFSFHKINEYYSRVIIRYKKQKVKLVLNKSLLIIFKIFYFILLGTNPYAETLKIKCENDWWNVVFDTYKTNKILIHRVGDVIFKVDDCRVL